MNIKSLLITVSVLVVAGCGGNSKKAESFTALPFPDVVPPAMLDNPAVRAEYMALHWWDGITDPSREFPCDTTMVSGVRLSDVEQRFANWVSVLEMEATQ